jgi:hypothetical protein
MIDRKNIPSVCKPAYKKAMSGRSHANAIKSFCWECMGYERAAVADCTDTGCPLYPYRPGRRGGKAAQE